MITIWKYEFTPDNEVKLRIPRGYKILHVRSQHGGHITLWVKVDTNEPLVQCTLYVYGTGHSIENSTYKQYAGTVLCPPFVWHVFFEQTF
jgi:hypothetical protein